MMWRDLTTALSLSNLCFIAVWRSLLLPSYSFYYYHTNVPPLPAEYVAVVLDVLLLATLFLIGARITRRSKSTLVKKSARVVFVLALSLPLYGLLAQVDNPSVRRFMMPFLGDQIMIARLLFTLPLTAALFLTLVALLNLYKAVSVSVALILILTPFVLVTFSQAAFMAVRYGNAGPGSTAPPVARKEVRKGPRVLWLVFDELDYRTVFSERPTTVKLGELDRLAGESLFATNAFPPSRETFLTFPALITGKLVSAARRVSPQELLIKFGDDGPAVSWSAQPNIFSRARELGVDTALVGWYHPYCRILGHSLTRCAWLGDGPLEKITEDVDRPPTSAVSRLVISMYAYAREAVRTAPLVAVIFPERDDKGEIVRRKQVLFFKTMYRQALEAGTDPDLGLVMVHWSIPHFPNIYNRSQNIISDGPGRSYLDNLQLVDQTIGRLRRGMESEGIWENTVVLVSSDHWWRSSEWKKLPGWTAEDESLGGETDRRVPFILKLAGEAEGATYASPFNTVLTHDLLLAILRGEVSDVKGAGLWLDRHRSIGRSPYDERSFRDAL
ncbi:MAG: sulfatase-like hydrolase/transferase [Pyrinomonadaceae bacterium]